MTQSPPEPQQPQQPAYGAPQYGQGNFQAAPAPTSSGTPGLLSTDFSGSKAAQAAKIAYIGLIAFGAVLAIAGFFDALGYITNIPYSGFNVFLHLVDGLFAFAAGVAKGAIVIAGGRLGIEFLLSQIQGKKD